MPPLFCDASLTLALPPHLARKSNASLTTAPKDKPVHKPVASLVDARAPFSPYLLKKPESTSSLVLPTTGLSTSAATFSPITTTTSLSGTTRSSLPPRQTRKAWASNAKDCDTFSPQLTVSMNISEDTSARQASDGNHQPADIGQATRSSLGTRAWSRRVEKSLENHPRSKVLREAWKRSTINVQPESPFDTGLLLEIDTFVGVPAQVGGDGISGVKLSEPTTIGMTSSSEATATPIAESASTSAIPPVGAPHQAGQNTWRISRLGPAPPPAPARLQTVTAPVLDGERLLKRRAPPERGLERRAKRSRQSLLPHQEDFNEARGHAQTRRASWQP